MPYKRNFKHIRESKPWPRTSLKKSKYDCHEEQNVNFFNDDHYVNYPKEFFNMNQSDFDYQTEEDSRYSEKALSEETDFQNSPISQTYISNSTQYLQVDRSELDESIEFGTNCQNENYGYDSEDFEQNQYNEDLLNFVTKINDKNFSEKNFESALVSLYLSGKFSQTGFRLLCHFLKIVVKDQFKPPSDINQCIERLISDDKLRFEKNWFCQNCCKIFTDIGNKFINACPNCNLKLQMNYKISIEEQIRRIFERNQYLFKHKN
ncbi:unnamed protein product [Brachionus calyciflorus]|uniref:Uncharacterized protein n=1 Tax=Brachionus calyciflorus TaxID=104777 RepID=A0A813ZSJ5_9BILA|nr:unnamed protein product [Brachionus calyciflorus]